MNNTSNPGNQRLNKRHAILTGAGGGIGAAVTAAYLREGARCSAVDLPTQPSAQVQALQTEFPGQLNYIAADVTQSTDITRLITQATDHFGPIHILFNNAAIFDMAPLLESDEAMYDKMFAVNVKGAFFIMQKVLANMVANQTRGAVTPPNVAVCASASRSTKGCCRRPLPTPAWIWWRSIAPSRNWRRSIRNRRGSWSCATSAASRWRKPQR